MLKEGGITVCLTGVGCDYERSMGLKRYSWGKAGFYLAVLGLAHRLNMYVMIEAL